MKDAIHKILALEPSRRNRALLRLLYAAGLRVFELCALTGQHLQERDNAGQVTVLGNGGKTRTVLLSAATGKSFADLVAMAMPLPPSSDRAEAELLALRKFSASFEPPRSALASRHR